MTSSSQTQLTVEWLPVGHITHGYRRVLIVRSGSRIQNVVALAPMPYEVVFQVQQCAAPRRVTDPSLWWGLSTVVRLIENGALDPAQNRDLPDDGYLLHRPTFQGAQDLIPVDIFQEALDDGQLVWPIGGDSVTDDNMPVSEQR
ncbi:hypothetical protein [Alicyclobacillus ferrooxydans]|uniref:Uncharacterized protein n=1 Tax=Alicyclobacillus ferrooxydans TaxID=471514 RepID=A0A0P9EIK0_9BACL|nr:hypothetical protein [Alicyclobacillus ferrooxydans]KPV42628.1 hypothetical protein AN477_16790 [Alicyclobacillus ferrooxydans]